MTEKEMREHICKESLKIFVDNAPNFPDKVKADLKEIIDCYKSPEEICRGMITYFAMFSSRI